MQQETISFGARRLHVPASCWTAAGGRGAPVVASEAAVTSHLPGTFKEGKGHAGGDDDEKRRQANRDKRAAKKRRAQEDREELKRLKGNPQSYDKPPKNGGGGKGKGKSKDQSGEPLCYSWDSGQGPCADVPAGGTCKCTVKRAHKCRKCLSPSHRSGDCNQWNFVGENFGGVVGRVLLIGSFTVCFQVWDWV